MQSYPFYIDDWRSSDAVAAMTAEERGIYRELIDQCWREGSLPNSDRALQNFARATDKEWKRSRKAVLACFYEEAGRLFSIKVSGKRAEIIEKKEERAERNKANGLTGGRKKKPRENPLGLKMEPTVNPHGTPSPSPSPSPLAADAARAAPSAIDGQVFASTLANELHEAHARNGLAPGAIHSTQHAIERMLTEEQDWQTFRGRMLASHAAWCRFWSTETGGFRPQVARWIRDGDWVHPPAVRAATGRRSAKELIAAAMAEPPIGGRL